MALTRVKGKTFLTLRGPETKATVLDCPAEGEWLAIRFKLGTFMPQLLPGMLRDHNDVSLRDASSRSFWLNGSAWQYTDFENAETFVQQLAKAGVIARDPLVDDLLKRQSRTLSLRSAQRHFFRSTGMTQPHSVQPFCSRRASPLSTPSTWQAISIRRTSLDPSSASLDRPLRQSLSARTSCRFYTRQTSIGEFILLETEQSSIAGGGCAVQDDTERDTYGSTDRSFRDYGRQ
jgi:hypothetical protein